ncbi:MAG: hypothetical protein S0880_26355 [Actinomycetota bacterium]|nr:hypothetical protein [Actinomycetota bacterium]
MAPSASRRPAATRHLSEATATRHLLDELAASNQVQVAILAHRAGLTG